MNKEKDVTKLEASTTNSTKSTVIAIVTVAMEALCECCIPLVLIYLVNAYNSFQSALSTSSDGMSATAQSQFIQTSALYGGILLGLVILAFIFAFVAAKVSAKAAVSFGARYREKIFAKTQELSHQEIKKYSKSTLITRLTSDVRNMQFVYMLALRIGVIAPIYLLFGFIATLCYGTYISWIYAISFPIILIGFIVLIISAVSAYHEAKNKTDKVNQDIEEKIHGIKTVKAHAKESAELKTIEKNGKKAHKAMAGVEAMSLVTNPIAQFCFQCSIILFVYLGAKSVLEDTLTLGEFQALINYTIMILQSLMMLSMIITTYASAHHSRAKVKEFLAEETKIKNKDDAITTVENGSVTFGHACFSYDENSAFSTYVLQNVTFDVTPGEKVGIYGPTASGKTTLLYTIPRFYDIQRGTLKIAGKEVNSYDIKALRDAISLASQKPIFFEGTIKENLTIGNPDASDDTINKALEVAHVKDVVTALPDGYDHKIEEGGANFSDGEKQSLCLARALIKPAKILLLDDALSAIDNNTAVEIIKNIKEAYPELTVLLASQSAACLEECDRLVILEQGNVGSFGAPSDLKKSNTLFGTVCQMQGAK